MIGAPPALRGEIRRFLDEIAAADEPPLSATGVETSRAMMLDRCLALWGGVDDVDRVDEHLVSSGDAVVGVRSYRPSAENELPGLVFLHGGGWVIGSVETHDGLCRRLANAAGCVVFSVEYRRAPESPFPAAVDDAVAALEWVHSNAGELDVDLDRISVAGDSAGGNLAAVAARKVTRRGIRLASQVLVYPVTDGSTDGASYEANADGYLLSRDDMLWYFGHYATAASDLTHPDLAPLRASDLTDLPPAYVITCEFDPLRDDGTSYAGRLSDAGVRVTLEDWPGMIHGFLLLRTATPAAEELVDRIARFLKDTWAASSLETP